VAIARILEGESVNSATEGRGFGPLRFGQANECESFVSSSFTTVPSYSL